MLTFPFNWLQLALLFSRWQKLSPPPSKFMRIIFCQGFAPYIFARPAAQYSWTLCANLFLQQWPNFQHRLTYIFFCSPMRNWPKSTLSCFPFAGIRQTFCNDMWNCFLYSHYSCLLFGRLNLWTFNPCLANKFKIK